MFISSIKTEFVSSGQDGCGRDGGRLGWLFLGGDGAKDGVGVVLYGGEPDDCDEGTEDDDFIGNPNVCWRSCWAI